MLDMSRNKSPSVICIINIYRISVKALLHTLDSVRRWIHQAADCPLSFILQGKTPLILFSFPDTHNDMRLRKYNLRLWDMKIPFCKSLDLIFQIGHLLIILNLSAIGQMVSDILSVSDFRAERRYYELYHHPAVSCNGRTQENKI